MRIKDLKRHQLVYWNNPNGPSGYGTVDDVVEFGVVDLIMDGERVFAPSVELRPEVFYPCIENRVTGHINVKVSRKPMTFEDARTYLEEHYPLKWRNCEATVQAENSHYFMPSDTMGYSNRGTRSA